MGMRLLWVLLFLSAIHLSGYGQNQDTVRREKIKYVAQETGLFAPLPEEVPPGHYSGIAYLGGSAYAVVDDKLNGSGLVFFNIDINDLGQVQSVDMEVPSSTSESKVAGKDCEGIAYVPAMAPADSLMREWRRMFGIADSIPAIKGNTLFISSEADQSIAEYDMEGVPTGRALQVPRMFARDKIYPNKGFEALTYNASTGLFWTTTEGPLKEDGEQSVVRYLQCFDLSLEPQAVIHYEMDRPRKSLAESKDAQAYVHGISAIAALDDGQLIVLEREVFVPKGGFLKMALESFSVTSLYLVNPAEAVFADGWRCGHVSKRLLCSFATGALGLANYEGMCLGPKLLDGRQTLVLIADSQGGSKGRVLEYVKVIALKAE